MIKKTITYVNFNDVEVTEDFFFNFTKAELIELEASEEGGISAMIERLEKSKKGSEILAIFKKVILQAYGEKTSDGKRFVKNQEIREAFQATEAYSAMFMEMATDADIGAAFFNGLIPKNIEQIVEAERQARANNAAKDSASGMTQAEMARARSEANMQGHRKTATQPVKPVPELATVSSNTDAQNYPDVVSGELGFSEHPNVVDAELLQESGQIETINYANTTANKSQAQIDAEEFAAFQDFRRAQRQQ